MQDNDTFSLLLNLEDCRLLNTHAEAEPPVWGQQRHAFDMWWMSQSVVSLGMPELSSADFDGLRPIADTIIFVDAGRIRNDYFCAAFGRQLEHDNGRSLAGTIISDQIMASFRRVNLPGVQGDLVGTYLTVLVTGQPAEIATHMRAASSKARFLRYRVAPMADAHRQATLIIGTALITQPKAH